MKRIKNPIKLIYEHANQLNNNNNLYYESSEVLGERKRYRERNESYKKKKNIQFVKPVLKKQL